MSKVRYHHHNLFFKDYEEGLVYFIGNHFVYYSRIACIHGVRFLTRRTAFERLFWASITLCCALLCIISIAKLIIKYREESILITYGNEEVHVYDIPFPAVTICPETKSVNSIFSYEDAHKKVTQRIKLETEEQKMYEYLHVICDGTEKHSHNENMTTEFFTEDFFQSLQNVSEHFNYSVVHCRWQTVLIDCSEIFTPVFLDEGICYTFNILDRSHILKDITYVPMHYFQNSIKNNNLVDDGQYKDSGRLSNYPRQVLWAGVAQSLEVTLRHNHENYDSTCKSALEGFRIVVHNPTQIPEARQNFFRASLEHSFSAAIDPTLVVATELHDAPLYKRDCFLKDEKYLKYFKKYSQSNCLMECLSNYTLLGCECVAYYMPRSKGIPVCGTLRHHCALTAEKELETILLNQDINKKINEESFCNCLPSCSSLEYRAEVTTSTSWWKDANASEHEKLIEMHFFFRHNTFVKTERKQIYTLLHLLHKIGGVADLWIGASIVTIIEFVYYWSVRLVCNKRLYRRWSEQQLVILD